MQRGGSPVRSASQVANSAWMTPIKCRNSGSNGRMMKGLSDGGLKGDRWVVHGCGVRGVYVESACRVAWRGSWFVWGPEPTSLDALPWVPWSCPRLPVIPGLSGPLPPCLTLTRPSFPLPAPHLGKSGLALTLVCGPCPRNQPPSTHLFSLFNFWPAALPRPVLPCFLPFLPTPGPYE